MKMTSYASRAKRAKTLEQATDMHLSRMTSLISCKLYGAVFHHVLGYFTISEIRLVFTLVNRAFAAAVNSPSLAYSIANLRPFAPKITDSQLDRIAPLLSQSRFVSLEDCEKLTSICLARALPLLNCLQTL
jgi:hypothetical protein